MDGQISYYGVCNSVGSVECDGRGTLDRYVTGKTRSSSPSISCPAKKEVAGCLFSPAVVMLLEMTAARGCVAIYAAQTTH